MGQLNKLQRQAAGEMDGQFRIEDLDKVIVEAFDNDLKSRLDFVGRVLDWQRFKDTAQGKG